MTTIWLDGFDNYINGDEAASTPLLLAGNYTDGVAAVSNAVSRTGNYSLYLNGNNWCVVKSVDPVASCVIGAAIYPTDGGTERVWGLGFAADWAGGNIIRHDLPNTGNGFAVFAYPGQAFRVIQYVTVAGVRTETVLYTSADNIIPAFAFTYIELKVDRATNTLQVWKNGDVKIVEISGLTLPVNDFDGFTVGRDNFGGSGSYIDDLYLTDGNLLGAQRCYYLFPNTDETPQDWAPSIGADAFAMLNNVPYDNTKYITATVVGNKSKFGCENLPMVNAVINAVRISSVQDLATSGSGDTIQRAFIGSGTYDGASNSLSTSKVYYNDTFDLLGVSVADINAMSLEIEKTV